MQTFFVIDEQWPMLRDAHAAERARAPKNSPSSFKWRCTDVQHTLDGYQIAIPKLVQQLPMALRDAPILAMGITHIMRGLVTASGLYEPEDRVYSAHVEVDELSSGQFQTKIAIDAQWEGESTLREVNDYYARILQGHERVTVPHDLSAS